MSSPMTPIRTIRPFLAAHLCRLMDDFVAFGRGGDQYPIRPDPFGEVFDKFDWIGSFCRINGDDPHFSSHLHFLSVEIYADYPATVGA